MGASGVTLTEARRAVVDFTIPYYEDPVSLLIPYPEVDGYPLEGMVKPYSLEVNVLLILSKIHIIFTSLLHYAGLGFDRAEHLGLCLHSCRHISS